MEWIGIPPNIEDYVGFVYLITNLTNGRLYIGKKLFWKKRKKKIKGSNKKVRVEHDWRDYYGSSNELNADIERLGKENFKREILECYKTRWEWSYGELKRQVDQEVLLNPLYYNGIIRVRLPKFKKKSNITTPV